MLRGPGGFNEEQTGIWIKQDQHKREKGTEDRFLKGCERKEQSQKRTIAKGSRRRGRGNRESDCLIF